MQTLDAPHPGMRLGWSEMTLVIDGRADVPLQHLIVRQEQGTRGRSSSAGRRTVGRTGWWDVLELGPGSEQSTIRCRTRHGRLWRGSFDQPCGSPMDPMHDRDRVAVRLGWSGMSLAIDGRAREMACPTRLPVGSPRKSAAIIPFVNKTVTSGLPIGSGRKCLMIWAMWASAIIIRRGQA